MTTGRMVVVALLALCGFWVIGAYNRLVRLRSAVVAAWGPIDSQLRRRQALAIELAELLSGPVPPTLEDEAGPGALQAVLAAARQAQSAAEHVQVRPTHAGAVQSLGLAEQVLDGALRPLRRLIDAQPALTAGDPGERVHALLAALQEADAQLAFVRRVFNEAVAAFNDAVQEWPTRLVAGVFGFRPAAAWQHAGPERALDAPAAA